jgi:hypothetical protein
LTLAGKARDGVGDEAHGSAVANDIKQIKTLLQQQANHVKSLQKPVTPSTAPGSRVPGSTFPYLERRGLGEASQLDGAVDGSWLDGQELVQRLVISEQPDTEQYGKLTSNAISLKRDLEVMHEGVKRSCDSPPYLLHMQDPA